MDTPGEGGSSMLRRRFGNRRGQSIMEYLLVAAAIIGAIIVFAPEIGKAIGGTDGTGGLGGDAQGRLKNAGDEMKVNVGINRF